MAVPILKDRLATWADAEPITAENAYLQYLDVSPDGGQLVIGSDRGGNQDLWILPSQGGEMMQLTMHPAPDDAPRWSPDGKELAFRSYRSGNEEVWVMPVEGGPARQLTFHPAEDSIPAWSPDGREIVFVSGRGGRREVWLVPSRGGDPRPVLSTANPTAGYFPSFSPDAASILFQVVPFQADSAQLWRVPAKGGEPEKLTDGPGQMPVWSGDGRTVYYTGWDERAGNLWAFSLEDRREYQVTDLVGTARNYGMGQSHGRPLPLLHVVGRAGRHLGDARGAEGMMAIPWSRDVRRAALHSPANRIDPGPECPGARTPGFHCGYQDGDNANMTLAEFLDIAAEANHSAILRSTPSSEIVA